MIFKHLGVGFGVPPNKRMHVYVEIVVKNNYLIDDSYSTKKHFRKEIHTKISMIVPKHGDLEYRKKQNL